MRNISKGYLILPPLDKKKCDSIVKQLESFEFTELKGYHKIKGFDFNAAHSNSYHIEDQKLIIQIPEVKELSNDPKILKIVKEYLGGKITQTQCNCWWSTDKFTVHERQKFHQDGTYEKFIKLFLYLNDVSMNNGPHTYVPGSRNNMITPDNYHVSQRVSEDFIKKNYSEIKYFTGKQGTMFLEDTGGWHKGLILEKGHRIILQLEWTTEELERSGVDSRM